MSIKAQLIDSVDVDVYELKLDLTQFKAKKMEGEAVISCKPYNGIKNHKIRFMLLKMHVDSVFYRANNSLNYEKVSYIYNDTILEINKNLDQLVQIKIHYHGSPIKDATWGGFYFNGEYAYNLGVGFTSNPHNYGRVWFPCIDNFTDKAIYKLSVTVPTGYTAVCGGHFIDTMVNVNKTTTWNWEHTYAIPTYLASVAVAPYKLLFSDYQGVTKKIPVILSAMAKDTLNLVKSFVNLNKAISAFESFYGPYRFERVGFSLVPFDGGAMEHACNVAYPVSAANGNTSKETLMAHELSHHWWGNNVTCKTASDMWINEGWAAYSEALFTDYVYGKKAYQAYVNANHKYVLQFSHLLDGTATAVDKVSHNNTYGTHVYKKGADMVHSIRGVMGDEAFKEKCKSFMEAYKGGNATTSDFAQHFNIPNGFVEQMISDTGFCHFSLTKFNTGKEGNLWKTTIHYRQVKRFGHHVYQNMPYEVFVFDKNFKSQVIKVEMGAQGIISFNTNLKPEFIAFDFDQKLSDAITDDVIVTDSVKKFSFNYSMMDVDIVENKDTSLIRIEHNWVYPDAWFNLLPNVLLSKERYWTVDGIFDPSFKASATVYYDGNKSNFTSGWLDNELLTNRLEDSIVLLYRPNAESYWQLETNAIKTIGLKNDKKGSFKINELKKGQYAFGVYGKNTSSGLIFPKKNEFNIYPNPSNDLINIAWIQKLNPTQIEIINSLGQVMIVNELKDETVNKAQISTKGLGIGNYYAIMKGEGWREIAGQFIVDRN
jgi:hypothetical protein